MEKKYQSLTLFEFQHQFPDDQAMATWPNLNGLKDSSVKKCEHTHHCKGNRDRTRQCTKCGHQATPTSNTLFHKVKFPIRKAFYIVYFIATKARHLHRIKSQAWIEIKDH